MATQHKIEPQKRGIATSTNTFFRSLGMTLGVTIFGTIQNHIMKTNLQDALGNMKGFAGHFDSHAIFDASARAKIPPEILHKISDAMASSVTTTFMWALIPIALAFIAILLMGNESLATPAEETRKKQAL